VPRPLLRERSSTLVHFASIYAFLACSSAQGSFFGSDPVKLSTQIDKSADDANTASCVPALFGAQAPGRRIRYGVDVPELS
jgi:hypothetical protein